MGSEPSAACGRYSEGSEWQRSKFQAPAVRQRRNFGHRNRITPPYETVTAACAQGGMTTCRPTFSYPSFPFSTILYSASSASPREPMRSMMPRATASCP